VAETMFLTENPQTHSTSDNGKDILNKAQKTPAEHCVIDHKDHTKVTDHGFSRHSHQNITELFRHFPEVIQKITTYFLLS